MPHGLHPFTRECVNARGTLLGGRRKARCHSCPGVLMTNIDRWIAVGATLAVCMTILLATFTISGQIEKVAATSGPCLRNAGGTSSR